VSPQVPGRRLGNRLAVIPFGYALLALLPLLACGGSGARALIPVDIAPGTVTGVATVDVVVTDLGVTGRELRRQRFEWKPAASGPLQVGVYLPEGFSGSVSVQARAFNASPASIGLSNQVTVMVSEGKRTPLVQLLLAPDAGGPDGGSDGGGRDGGADGSRDAPAPDTGPPSDGRDAAAPDGPGTPDAPADTAPIENRAWTAGTDIEQDQLASSYTPDVAIDGAGNVLVAWREGVGVKLRRQDGATRNWGALQTIEDRGTTDAVQVAMGTNGRALVVWYMRTSEVAAELQGLWARHSSDGGLTWSGPVRVHEGPVYYEIALAMSAGGLARVAWQESASNINTLWSAHFDPGSTSFQAVGPVLTAADTDERYPRVALDDDGGGLMAWVQDDEQGEDSIWAASIAGATTGVPQLIDAYTTDSAGEVDIAIAADGSRGMAVWQQRNGSTSASLHYNEWSRPSAGTGFTWKGPMLVHNADWVSSPAVVIDRTGQAATVAFVQPLIGYRWNVLQTRWTPSAGWSAAQPLETTNQAGGDAEDPIPHLGIDAAGNVHAVWRRKAAPDANAPAKAIVRRYGAAAMAWDPEVVIGEVPDLKAYHPEIAVAGEGRAAAAFYFLDPAGTGAAASFNVFVAFFR
jgi:hypothetical protein